MSAPLKRDMDMVRSLLLEIEQGKTSFQIVEPDEAEILGIDPEHTMPKEVAAKLVLHLKILADAEFITLEPSSGGFWYVTAIRKAGYDFLDSVRDPKVWKMTKEQAAKAGGFTLDLLASIAKGFIKTKIQKHTGIEIEF